jgi:hypothetical protein
VLSASALVAVGTSLLLAALVGLGISELGGTESGGPSARIRTEAAAVVVPGGDAHQRESTGHARHSTTVPTVATYPVTTPVAPASTTTSRSTVTTTTATPTSTRLVRASSTPSPTASPTATRAHGKGKGNGAGTGQGHRKPSKP